MSVIPPNLTANYCCSLFFSKLNDTQHPSKPRMNFSKRGKKKAFVEKVILYVSSVQSALLIGIRAFTSE